MALNLDRMMYLVIEDHRRGPYFREIDVDQTGLTTVAKDIRDGQYSDVLAVIEINPVEGICREVTHDFKAVIDRRAD